jgi:signal transduction histidine kinase
MTQERMRRIFDPFYTTQREQGGMGMGLAIARGIVDDHEGTIDVRSTPDEGTTFHIRLPIRPSDSEDSPLDV